MPTHGGTPPPKPRDAAAPGHAPVQSRRPSYASPIGRDAGHADSRAYERGVAASVAGGRFRASRFTARAGATAQARHPATRHAGAAPGCTTSHGTDPAEAGAGPFGGDGLGPAITTTGAYAFRLRWADAMMGRTLPMQAPDLSAVSSQAPSSPRAVPAPPAPPDYPFTERTFPMQARDVPAAPQAVEPQPVTTAPPPQPVGAPAEEPAGTSGDVLPAPKSKLIPVMFGGLAIALLAAAMWGYWKFHQIRTAPAPPPQVAVQTPPVTPPPAPVSTPVATPTPPPAAAAEQPTPPISAAPGVAKKTAVHRPKQAIVPPPSAPAPAPPPAQPQPVIVTPPPMPSPPTPSPEDIAKAEAAKLANIPRIVQVLCNFGFKEATFTFSSGGQTLFEETLKGKKKKGGFLGIKGSYEGTFTHTITVPAGASEVSIHVVAKDGATDLSKAIKMPPPGGFVPTLAVEVDSRPPVSQLEKLRRRKIARRNHGGLLHGNISLGVRHRIHRVIYIAARAL